MTTWMREKDGPAINTKFVELDSADMFSFNFKAKNSVKSWH